MHSNFGVIVIGGSCDSGRVAGVGAEEPLYCRTLGPRTHLDDHQYGDCLTHPTARMTKPCQFVAECSASRCGVGAGPRIMQVPLAL